MTRSPKRSIGHIHNSCTQTHTTHLTHAHACIPIFMCTCTHRYKNTNALYARSRTLLLSFQCVLALKPFYSYPLPLSLIISPFTLYLPSLIFLPPSLPLSLPLPFLPSSLPPFPPPLLSFLPLSLLRPFSPFSYIRAEKDALDNVRRSMEAELDRCRLELSGLRSMARDTEQDGQATFEVEKLLGALKTTMDQVTATAAVAGDVVYRTVRTARDSTLIDFTVHALCRVQFCIVIYCCLANCIPHFIQLKHLLRLSHTRCSFSIPITLHLSILAHVLSILFTRHLGGSTGTAPMSRLSPYVSKPVPHTDTGDQGILAPSLSSRVDAAVARLGEFRTWTREDAKVGVFARCCCTFLPPLMF